MNNSIRKIKKELYYLIGGYIGYSAKQPKFERKINVSKKQIKYYASTPNTIIFYDNGKESGFLRECRVHSEKHEYLRQLIWEYAEYVLPLNYKEEFLSIISDKLSNESNFKKFFEMGAGTADYTRIARFRKSLDSSVIGIDPPYPEWFGSLLIPLVQYAWGPLDEYKYCKKTVRGGVQTFNSNRTMITKHMADAIECCNLVPTTEYVALNIDGEIHKGVSVDIAKGIEPICQSKGKVTPNFQLDCLHLNVLDVLTAEKDHRPGNYMVQYYGDDADSLSAFDNDCPTTLFPFENACFSPYVGITPLVSKSGNFNRRYLDKNFASILRDLDIKQMMAMIHMESTFLMRLGIKRRLHQVKKAIKKSESKGDLLLVDGMSNDTVEFELKDKSRLTYMKYFYENFSIGRG